MSNVILPRFTMSASDTRLHRHVTTPDGEVLTQRRADGSLHSAAKSYRMTDPVQIAAALERAGFTVGRCVSLFSHGTFEPRNSAWKPSAWKYGLEVLFPLLSVGARGDYYQERMRILLAHDGRHAVRFGKGVLRLNCTNQFTNADVAIRHTDPALDKFLADPAGFLLELAGRPGDTVKRIDALRDIRVPHAFYTAMGAYSRVKAAVDRELFHYPQGDMWALAQALTASRKPRALKASMSLLAEGFPEALEAWWRRGLDYGLDVQGVSPTYFDCWRKPLPAGATN